MKMILPGSFVLIVLLMSSCTWLPGTDAKAAMMKNTARHTEGYIPKDSANKMIQSYLTSIDADLPAGSSPDLNALLLDADLIRDYLCNSSIRGIKVMFAHKLDYINQGKGGLPAGYNSDAFTIVLAGYDSDGNYVYADMDMVPDHATPCPRNCNIAGSSSNNLLK